jgi:hypothetical protein
MSAEKMQDRIHAAVAGTVDGRTQIWDVMLDLEVVALRGHFAASDDVAIEHSSVSPGFAVPQGRPVHGEVLLPWEDLRARCLGRRERTASRSEAIVIGI